MNAIDFNNYLFRCSSLGKLMVGANKGLTDNQNTTLIGLIEKRNNAKLTDKQTITLGKLLEQRDAPKELSSTTKSYLKTLHREEMMKRSKKVQSKYLDKGVIVEEKSISLYSSVFGKLLLKNKQRFHNKFITGEPDNIQGIVRDFKSSFDFSTFPLYETDITNEDYKAQLHGYMNLTGITESELIYCLIDTPNKIIEDELRRLDWRYSIFNIEGEIREECIEIVVEKVQEMIFTEKGLEEFCNYNPNIKKEWFTDFFELPEEMRIKVFPLVYDKEFIEIMQEQISKSREYLNELTLTIAKDLIYA